MPTSVNTADEYEFVDHNDTVLSPEILAKIREWLQPTDYLAESGEFRRHLLSRAPGTGLWICETEEYKKWHDSPDHGSLWIKGVTGAGKSVTAASIIQHLRTTEDFPVLFFFFRNIVAANFSPRALVQDWLAQLLPYSPKLQFALQSRLESSLAETSDNDLIQVFLDGLSCVPKVYCVGDALDEMMMTDNGAFLEKLNGLATYRPRSVKLLITSRPKQYLQSALRDSSIVHISLQQRLVDADIISFLSHRFDLALKSNTQRPIKQQIIDMVARRSEGLFLYAKLTMDQVEAAFLSEDPVDIGLLEESLPVGLEQIYTSVLAKQREEHGINQDLQVMVLEAVTHASRPLRLNELASLTQSVCADVVAPEGFKALIATCCGPLVEILEDETLQVIHHSFTEFLRGDNRNVPMGDVVSSDFPIIDSDKAHKRIATHCLQYLQSGTLLLEEECSQSVMPEPAISFKAPTHRIDRDREHYQRSILGVKEKTDPFRYREARLLHPFLSYAIDNWSYHASRYDVVDEEFFATVIKFLSPDSLSFWRWLVIKWGSTAKSAQSVEGIPTALHIAAFSGMSELASKLIQQGASISALDAQERVPLHWAADNGHTKIMQLLLQHGSDPNPEDGRGLKPIHLAALKNHASVVTVLLKAGVKPETIKTKENHAGRLLGGERITRGESAIDYASKGGHTETVVAMIPFCEPKILEQLLCECCENGQTDAVLAILDKSDVSPNATYREATALYYACVLTSAKCVEALIGHGADVSKTSTWTPRPILNGQRMSKQHETAPLHRLVQAWTMERDLACQAIFRMLVKANVDLEQPNGHAYTALQIAAGAGRFYGMSQICIPAVRALLESGADAKKKNNRGDTVLHLVFQANCDPEAVRLLIEHGSDPNQRGDNHQTALHKAISSYSGRAETITPIVKYLLEHGADPNLRDGSRRTALELAVSTGPEILKMLLPRCPDNALRIKCWSMLPSFHGLDFAGFLELLLAEGMDINKGTGGTSLYLQCIDSDEKRRILREHGARTDVVDASGCNALHITCKKNRCLRTLLEKLMADDGIDPLSTDTKGNTLLHHVAAWYNTEQNHADYVRWLVSLGIPINAMNSEGFTALHVAQTRPPSGSTLNSPFRVHFIDAINDSKTLKFEIRNNDGLTPLHLSSMRSEYEVATLVAAGADLGTLTEDSQNVLHLACRARQANIVGQILDQLGSVDVNQRDCFGRTPLHYACSAGEPESVAFLLKHGADVHASDSECRTPLHACAEFTAEQDIWQARGRRYKHPWLRGPRADALRPSKSDKDEGNSGPWYRYPNDSEDAENRKRFFPGVCAIVKMLLDANADVAAVDYANFTALDVALTNGGCPEVTEIFLADEDLFDEATQNVEENSRSPPGHVQRVRQRMRVQMQLMRPWSSLDALGQDKASLGELLSSPGQYMELLTSEDIAQIVNGGFDANPLDPSCYKHLERLMKPGHLQVAELVPRLLMHYSSYESAREKIEIQNRDRKYCYATTSWTALQLACRSAGSNMQMLQLLVEKLHVDVNARNATIPQEGPSPKILPGGTALHELAAGDHWWQIEGLKYLLAHGATVDARDEKGETPVHRAARGFRFQNDTVKGLWAVNALRILVDHGADVNAVDNDGLSPLHKASAAPEIMKELLLNGADATAGKITPLFLAIHDQSLPALEVLLDHGVSVDSIDKARHSRQVHYSFTEPRKVYALLCAAFASKLNSQIRNSVPLLRAFVRRGADLYVPLSNDETMIHFLFEHPEYEVQQTLLEEPCASRIDFDRRDQHGRTVLMAACDHRRPLPGYVHKYHGPKPPVKAPGPPLRILDLGADATLVDNHGKTALHRILENPSMPDEVILQFINRKEVAPILFVKDRAGFLPFHYALRVLRPEVCELLVSKGANLHEPDPNGLTALHYIATHCLENQRIPRQSGCSRIILRDDHFASCLALWQRFITEGGSINVTDNAHNTPLLAFLISEESAQITREPILCHVEHFDKLFPADSGVDVFAVNDLGETALHLIARRPNTRLASRHDKALFEMMMGKGLDPWKNDVKGRSALDVASACEKDGIVGLFGRK